jgi:hypothetical protein
VVVWNYTIAINLFFFLLCKMNAKNFELFGYGTCLFMSNILVF